MSCSKLGSQQSWHSEMKLYYTLDQLHSSHANINERADKETKDKFQNLLSTLDEHLRSDEGVFKLKRIEFTGSSYEKLKVKSSPMEFDVMLVMSGGCKLDKVEFCPQKPGFTKMRPKPGSEIEFWSLRDPSSGYISAAKAQYKLRGRIHKILQTDNYFKTQANVQPKEHGPALQLDIYDRGWEYSVDLVLAYEIKDHSGCKELYVAKRFQDEEGPFKEDVDHPGEMAWRRSFSLEEKAKLRTIDSDQGCRRKCARIFKVLRDMEADLRPISSYLIKTVLFHLDEKYDSRFWGKQNLRQCMMTFMWEMSQFFQAQQLDHFFIEPWSSINLLEGLPSLWLSQVADRLQRLVVSETQFYRLVESIQGPKCFTVNGDKVTPVTEAYDLEEWRCRFDGGQGGAQAYAEKEEEGVNVGAIVGGVAAGIALLGLGAFALSKVVGNSDEEKKKKKEF